jgi:hypothetical protein
VLAVEQTTLLVVMTLKLRVLILARPDGAAGVYE